MAKETVKVIQKAAKISSPALLPGDQKYQIIIGTTLPEIYAYNFSQQN